MFGTHFVGLDLSTRFRGGHGRSSFYQGGQLQSLEIEYGGLLELSVRVRQSHFVEVNHGEKFVSLRSTIFLQEGRGYVGYTEVFSLDSSMSIRKGRKLGATVICKIKKGHLSNVRGV